MAASDRSAASANHQAQLSESSGSRSPALGLRRGCSVPPWPCGELDQALMASAGEASAQVVLVAGEGIGDSGAVVRWCGSGRRNPGLAACVPDAERGHASIAVTAPDTAGLGRPQPVAVTKATPQHSRW
jgi:hypothetical protein